MLAYWLSPGTFTHSCFQALVISVGEAEDTDAVSADPDEPEHRVGYGNGLHAECL